MLFFFGFFLMFFFDYKFIERLMVAFGNELVIKSCLGKLYCDFIWFCCEGRNEERGDK